MKYFKNKELTTLYNVSDKTVRNWIAASQEGKLELKLLEDNSRVFIADSIANTYLLEQLSISGKKYRNNRNSKVVTPTADFYRSFNLGQIIDIANSLDNYHEISWHYSYFGRAGTYWDKYLKELHDAGKPNLITNTIETLNMSANYVDALIEPFKYVNVVNICIGNNIALKSTLERLQKQKKLKRFIAVDISPRVLEISEKNVELWFNKTIYMEKCQMDIRHETFSGVLNHDSYGSDASKTVNLLFFIAGPIVNFREPHHILSLISNAMNKNDLLFTSIKRDTPQTRGFFDFNVKSDTSPLGIRRKMLLDMLNIDESMYEAEQGLDADKATRYIRVRLKSNLVITFEKEKFKKTVELRRGETLLLWKSQQYSDLGIVKLLDIANFTPVQVIHSLDNQLTMQISKINTAKQNQYK